MIRFEIKVWLYYFYNGQIKEKKETKKEKREKMKAREEKRLKKGKRT